MVPTCDHMVGLTDAGLPRLCDKVAVRRYAASGGGWAYMCAQHAKGMEKYSEPCYAGEDDSPLDTFGTPTEGGEG